MSTTAGVRVRRCAPAEVLLGSATRVSARLVSLEWRVAGVVHTVVLRVVVLVHETVCQAGHVLLGWHMGQGPRRHLVLEAAHIAPVGVLSLQEVVHRHCIMAGHGWVPPVVVHYVAFLDVVQE